MDRNGSHGKNLLKIVLSLSARRAWIEISCLIPSLRSARTVALRKESVDRNIRKEHLLRIGIVALRKESVDRNHRVPDPCVQIAKSLSARRAWIEIGMSGLGCRARHVALRKESVDRNLFLLHGCNHFQRSLSARRAWIEILPAFTYSRPLTCRSPQGERG